MSQPASLLPQSLPTRLGGYHLIDRLGSGGMGVVYRAVAPGGGEVAVKVIRDDVVNQTETRRRFLREARAAARLEHPNIARLFDFGVIEGRYYLSMELVKGGSLAQWRWSPPDGAQVVEVFEQVLAALAYAHARGVVHRDLKPENVLIGQDASGRWFAKLMDFGVAHFRDDAPMEGMEAETLFVGTPAYMSPEQAVRATDVCPATDLYAVGVMLFEVLAGRLPFTGENMAAMLMAHMGHPIPELEVRAGYQLRGPMHNLVRKLLSKEPTRRFMFASDARRALQSCRVVGRPERWSGGERGAWSAPSEVAETRAGDAGLVLQALATVASPEPMAVVLDATTRMAPRGAAPPAPEQAPAVKAPAAGDEVQGAPGPLAALYARARSESPLEFALPAGLAPMCSMFGVRDVPLQGRTGERARLLALAETALSRNRGVVALVTGELGMGKSRLMSSLRESLEELGRMQVWFGQSSEGGSLSDGAVRAALRHGLGLHGVMPGAYAERIASDLDRHGVQGPWEVDALTEYLLTSPPAPDARPLLESEESRFALVERVLQRAAKDRPVALVLEDAHLTDGLTLRMAEWLLAGRNEHAPWLLVITLRPEQVPAAGPLATAVSRLRSLASRGELDLVRLGRLRDADITAMVQSSVPVERVIADAVTRRAEGNPLFAVELIRQLVDSGQLEGFGDAPQPVDILERLPGGIRALLGRRVDDLLASERGGRAVELVLNLVAILGERVSLGLIHTAVELAGWEQAAQKVEPALNAALSAHVLVEDEPNSFRFDSALLRDVLLDRIEAQGEGPLLHEMAARARVLHLGRSAADHAYEIGRHLRAAGLVDEAFSWWMTGAQQATARRRFHTVLELCNAVVGLADELELDAEREGGPSPVPAAVLTHCRLLLTEALAVTGNHELAHRIGRSLVAELEIGSPTHTEALRLMADVAIRGGHLRQARWTLLQAMAGCAELGDRHGEARCSLSLAEVELRESRLIEAARILRQTTDEARALGDSLLLARALLASSRLARLEARAPEARLLALEAQRLFVEASDRAGVADALVALAEAVIDRGQHAAAAEHLREARLSFDEIGDRHGAARSLLVLGRAVAEQERATDARALFEEAADVFSSVGDPSFASVAQLARARVAAESGDWEAANDSIDHALSRDNRERIDMVEFVDLLVEVGRLAKVAGHAVTARRLLSFASLKVGRLDVTSGSRRRFEEIALLLGELAAGDDARGGTLGVA
jgi:serine/threonine-protein kinase